MTNTLMKKPEKKPRFTRDTKVYVSAEKIGEGAFYRMTGTTIGSMVIGGSIGSGIGGPIGTVVGATVGAVVGYTVANHEAKRE